MFFNRDTETWEQDSINDVDINVEKGEVKFRTIHFQPTAVVQHTYSEFPYRDWWIETQDLNKALVTIQGKVNKIQILVENGECELMYPLETQYMKNSFKGKKMSASTLLLVCAALHTLTTHRIFHSLA